MGYKLIKHNYEDCSLQPNRRVTEILHTKKAVNNYVQPERLPLYKNTHEKVVLYEHSFHQNFSKNTKVLNDLPSSWDKIPGTVNVQDVFYVPYGDSMMEEESPTE